MLFYYQLIVNDMKFIFVTRCFANNGNEFVSDTSETFVGSIYFFEGFDLFSD